MSRASDLPVWQKLQEHAHRLSSACLAGLFAENPSRAERFTLRLPGIEADFSRHVVDDDAIAALLELAQEQRLALWRDKMFAGEKINTTEDRAVLHTALRAQTNAPVFVDGKDVVPEIRALQRKMETFSQAVRSGAWRGATDEKITDVVNIGIGGSDLGPRLAANALKNGDGPRAHFIANVDAAELTDTLAPLDPARTLFIVVSKTFTTQETLLNARSARAWLVQALGEAATEKHFVAVSTNRADAEAFGIKAENMFPMWDWIGGRYSLWSSVGLILAVAIGWDGFKALLAGAAAMDDHFRTAPLQKNMPILMALLGLWERNFKNAPALAILPYSERLRDLPRYLQQLDMESNGKAVSREGEKLSYATGPVIFGECGSVGQHSFHQWLHQGTDVIPADFIGIEEDAFGQPEHHDVLTTHMSAQIEALLSGCADPNPARENPGNKPSNVLRLKKLDPYHLGLLLALYEHKIFCQGVLWGINSFDQFGVELGKKLARDMLARKTD